MLNMDELNQNYIKDRKRQLLAIGFLILVAGIYMATILMKNGEEPQKVTELFFADRMTPAHEELIARYNAENSGKVRVIPVDFPNFDFSTNERKELLARSLRGRETGIDILAVDLIWVQRFAKWSEPLEQYFSDEEIGRILPVALESCYYEGELMAVPFDLVQGVLYYRTDLVGSMKNSAELINKLESGITWEELLAWQRYADQSKPYYIFPAASFEGFICTFTELLLSQNPRYFTDYGFDFNTSEARRSLHFLTDLIHTYKATPTKVADFTDLPSFEYFLLNDAYFVRGWPTYDKDFVDSPIDTNRQKLIRKVMMPHFRGSTPASVFGGWNLMVSKFSSKKAEAIDFIKFLLRTESQELMYSRAGYYPVIGDLYTDPGYQSRYPELKENLKKIGFGVHRPRHEEYTKYSEIMSAWFTEAVQGKVPVEKALINASSAIRSEALEKKNGY